MITHHGLGTKNSNASVFWGLDIDLEFLLQQGKRFVFRLFSTVFTLKRENKW